MQFGIFSVSDVSRDPVTGYTPSEAERIDAIVQIEMLGGEVILAVRKELAARKVPESAEAPTHALQVKAKYGDESPRQPRPNANRGDNVTGGSPYQDGEVEATYPVIA